jgi:hypothetical protein
MTRLSASGTAIAAPYKSKVELKRALSEQLHIGELFDLRTLDELYWKLGLVIAKWLSELARVEVSPVAKALLSTAQNLSEASTLLSGLEEGFHSEFATVVTSEVTKYLAFDPAVGSQSKACKVISAFQQDAARIAHVCMVARAGLPSQSGPRGRPALGWYDDFTALLIEIAEMAGVAPTLRKGRIDQVRSGWLFDAAQALEPFLYPEMRSPTAEACGKRLERSRKALGKPNRQKPRAR